MVSPSPLNRYLTIKKIKEYALLKTDTIKNNCKLRYEMDEHVLMIKGMQWHLADYKSLLDELLEPINYRFPDRLLNDRPYDYSLFLIINKNQSMNSVSIFNQVHRHR